MADTTPSQNGAPAGGGGSSPQPPQNLNVSRATVGKDGEIILPRPESQVRQVDIADVDLLVTFSDGSRFIIPNGALDAIGPNPPPVVFSDGRGSASGLFKKAGTVVASTSGSLRLITDNIDTKPAGQGESSGDTPLNDPPPPPPPPPAPKAPSTNSPLASKPGAVTGTGAGPGTGVGQGEVQETIKPTEPPPPPVYKLGSKKVEIKSIEDYLSELTSGKNPSLDVKLFTSSNFKLDPSWRSDLPVGAYDPTATTDQLLVRSAAAAQATREIITGTSGNDTIIHNSAFSSSASQWSKAFHVGVENFGTISEITLTFSSQIFSISGFDIQGAGVSRVLSSTGSPTTQWKIDPALVPRLSTEGLNLSIVYDVSDAPGATDFTGDLTFTGTTNKLPVEVTNNLNLTLRPAVSQADFSVKNSAGVDMMVLPKAGMGYEINAGDGNDQVVAGAGADLIRGEAGNDSLDGGTGNDILDGGAGTDVLIGGAGTDTASYLSATSGVQAALAAIIPNTGDAFGDSYDSIENLQGSNFNDTLVGTNGVNTITGEGGDDVIEGLGAADIINGGDGQDTASYAHAGSAVSVTLSPDTGTANGSLGDANGDMLTSIENLEGSNFDDTLRGDANNNTLSGGLGNDLLEGGQGQDALIGGGGTDTATYANASGGVALSLTSGLGIVQTGEAFGDTFDSIENVMGSRFADTLVGSSQNNTLDSGAGDDVLEGMQGADILIGGLGNDTTSYAHASGGVVASLTRNEDFAAGTALTQAGDAVGDTFSSVENMVGSAFSDTLVGSGEVNILTGGNGDDSLEGLGGADTLDGGAGNNTASYAHYAGSIAPSGNVVGVTASLSSPNANTGDAQGDTYINIQNLTGSDFADTLTGDGNNNVLIGGSGNDILEGRGGADTLDGGTGTDTASYTQAQAAVTATLFDPSSNAGDAAGDTYVSIENVTGSDFNDTLTGSSAANVLTGGLGNDTLQGMAGADQLIGGTGTDTADYSRAGQVSAGSATVAAGVGVTASLSTSFTSGPAVTQTGDAAGDTFSSIENLTGSDFNDTLVGDSGINLIQGGAGNDSLEGMGGADTLDGGSGTNTASYEHANAVSGATGVQASLTDRTLNTGDAGGDTYINIQNLTGSAFNDTLIGSSVANTLSGGDGDDTLEGMAGADALIGGNGTNTASYAHAAGPTGLVVSLTNAALNTGDAAGDSFTEIQNVIGSNFDDLITGDTQNNRLDGGEGADILIGGSGADALVGGNGLDTASFSTASGAITASLTTTFTAGANTQQSGDALGDTYDSIENIVGSNFNDTLIGNSANNTLTGGQGDDTLEGMGGADTLIGGSIGIESDTASYAHATQAVTASLTDVTTLAGTAVSTAGDAAGDIYSSIENLAGSDFNDTLIGDAGVNTLSGSGGDDVLEGLAGGDVLQGGAGSDTASYDHATARVDASLTTSFAINPPVGNFNSGDAAGDTYSSIENLYGSRFNDSLIGDSAANVLTGGQGDDTLEGMAGADTLDGGTGNNTASYNHWAGAITGGGSVVGVTASLSSPNANTGDAQGDTYINIQNLTGSDFTDTLTGDSNANILTGGGGNDVLEGMGSGDVLDGGTGTDTASYTQAQAAVTATLFDPGSNAGDAAGDTYVSIENVTGSDFNDTLTGSSAANVLTGGLGNDTLQGMAGADQLIGGTGTDTADYSRAGQVSAGSATVAAGVGVTASLSTSFTSGPAVTQTGDAAGDTFSSIENLTGSDFNDTLVGDSGINLIQGGAGNDSLEGMGGADTLDGGSGTNTASYEHANAVSGATGVQASLTDRTLNTGDAGGDTYINIQNLTGSAFNDTLIGSSVANTLSGGDGDDTLEGMAGADALIGGNGTNTASYAHAAGPTGLVVSLTNAALNTGDAAGDSFTEIQNVIGSNFDDLITGDTQNNRLDGGEGADILIGGSGADALVGGNGLDTASFSTASGAVTASLTTTFTAGANTQQSGDALGDTYDSIENIVGSNFNDTLIGNSANNTLTGGQGDDTLEGMGGADTLIGGSMGIESDTASYAHATQAVTASLTDVTTLAGTAVSTAGDAAGDIYSSIENLAGSDFNDTLIGDAGVNTLSGSGGDDVLEGLAGGDVLQGGAGSDTASYDHATARVDASLTTSFAINPPVGNFNSGDAAGDTYSSIENLYGSRFNDSLIGDSAANVLTGGQGDDTLEGMAGADTLDGGTGNNTASYNHWAGAITGGGAIAGVTASLTSPNANTGDAQGDTYTNIQNLIGSNFTDTLTGDGNVNILTGGGGNDALEGMGGADVLDGGAGTDTASYAQAQAAVRATLFDPSDNLGDATGDTYVSIENLTGSDFNDTLVGNNGSNVITGGIGNDFLQGMAGADQLIGGNGSDTADYSRAGQPASGSATSTTGTGVVASLTTVFTSGAAVTQSGDAAGDTYSEIENLNGSDYADTLIGDSSANLIQGGGANDILEGMGGADSLDGGTGNNTASYDHANAVSGATGITASLTDRTQNTGDATGDSYTNIQNLTGSAFNDTLIGDAGINILTGGSGDDILEGMGGADNLQGGSGSNTASYAHAGRPSGLDGITISLLDPSANTGDATGDTYTNIQNLIASGFDDLVVGDTQDNRLDGGEGADTLIGGSGADALIGGNGTDTASFSTAASAVVASLTTSFTAGANLLQAGDATGDTYSSIENVIGSNFNDTLVGNGSNNTLFGGTGNDILEGMAGADTLNGGAIGVESDTASYAHAASAVVASLTSTSVLVGTHITIGGDASGDTYFSIENLTGSDFNDTLIGDGGANILTGNDGDDTLEGLAGNDQFIGGNGSDTASYDHATVGVQASLTTAFTVNPPVGSFNTNDAAGDTYTGIENLLGSAHNDYLIGDTNDNGLNGGEGNDTLEGMGGADVLAGGNGNDTASYNHATSGVVASLTTTFTVGSAVTQSGHATGDVYTSIENLTGSDFADTLIGDGGINILTGGAGDDVLEGMGGADTLDGGTGVNTASYEHAPDNTGLGVTASLSAPGSNTGQALGDVYTNIQNLLGSGFDDTLTGDSNNNTLWGGDGNDNLSGLGGTDILYGGNGNDIITDDGIGAARLYGEAGDDRFILTGDDATIDTIDGGTHTNGVGDTIVWNAPSGQYNRIDVDMNTRLIYVRSPVAGNNISFSNIENFTTLGNNSIYIYLDNYSNKVDSSSNGATVDYVDYRYALGSIHADLSISSGVNVWGGSSVLDSYDSATKTWSGTGDTLSGIERIYYGSQYADNLIGDSFAENWIQGGRGADYQDGGAGASDVLYVDYWGQSNTIGSLLTAAQNSAMGIVMWGACQGDTIVNIEGLYANASAKIYGNEGSNRLWGSGTIEGFIGADYHYGWNTGTVSYENAGSATAWAAGITTALNTGVTASLTTSFSAGGAVTNSGDAAGDTYDQIQKISGSAFDDVLIGNANGNTLTGNAGNDVLEGMSGSDVLVGGAGVDSASYAHATSGVLADLGNTGLYTTAGDAAGDSYSGIENLVGSTFADTLYGDNNGNTIEGGLGNDAIDGGGNFDFASYANSTGSVNVNLSTGVASGSQGDDSLVSIEGVIGSNYADTITGNGDDNIIDGGLLGDTLDGGAGTDTLSYQSATGGVTVNMGTNTYAQGDTATGFENLLGSIYADSLTGDDNDNVIEGGLGNDILNGGANGVGGDTVSYSKATAGVTVTLATPGVQQNTIAAGRDTLSNFENLTGSDYADTLTGDSGNNAVNGGLGNDTIHGTSGDDALTGGSGTDTVSYANLNVAIAATINGTVTKTGNGTDTLQGIENLIGSSQNDTITGDGNNNLIDGGLGDDTITGNGGTDTVTYASAAAGISADISDTVSPNNVSGGAGNDRLLDIDNLIGSAFDDNFIGDGNANVFEGGAGNDVLDGGGGTDTVSYASAASAVSVNLSTPTAQNTGGAGTDTLSNFENVIGSAYNDTLRGDGFANVIDGGDGDDTLIGGAGGDTIIGGAGTDTASYSTATGAVTANLSGNGYRGVNQVGDASGDSFSGVENLIGSGFNDSLMGTTGNNTITGGAGNDTMWGDNGNDVFYANQGNDTVYGENDNDTFYVSSLAPNLPNLIAGGGRDGGYIENHGGNVMVLQDLVNGGSYNMATLATKCDYIDTLDIRQDGVSTQLTFASLDIRLLNDGGNTSQIFVKANAGDTLNISLAAGETMAVSSINRESLVAGGGTYTDYTIFDANMGQVGQIHWHSV